MARTTISTEDRIQSAVWQIELGRGKIVIYWILLVLLALALALLYTAVEFRGLETRESMDQAQLARNISRGQGFTTYLLRPLSMWHLESKAHWSKTDPRLVMDHPDLENPPLYPYLLAGLFKLLPAEAFAVNPEDQLYRPERLVIVPLSQLCLLLTLALVYLWARQLFDQRVALTTGLLLLFSDHLWRFSISGLSTTLAMLLIVLLFFCLYKADIRLNPKPDGDDAIVPPGNLGTYGLIFASAVLLGLSFLTRYGLGLMLVPALIYLRRILRGRRPVAGMIVYAVVFLLVIAPWLARNHSIAKSWLGTAGYELVETGGPFSGTMLQRSYDPTVNGNLDHAFAIKPIAAKTITGLQTHLFQTLRNTGGDYLIFFFAVGLMYGFRRLDVSRLRWVILVGIGMAIVAMSVFGFRRESVGSLIAGDNLLALFIPFIAMYGVAFFYLLLDRIPFRIRLTRGVAIGAFALLNVAPMIFTLLPPRRETYPYPPYIPPVTKTVASWFEPNTVGSSDLPWAMAWQGDRRTVWLPMTVQEFYDIHDFAAPDGLSFLMLTPYMLDQPLMSGIFNGEYQGWSTVVKGKIPAQFPLKAVTTLPPKAQQFLFADRTRWKDMPIKDPILKSDQRAPKPGEPPADTSVFTEPPPEATDAKDASDRE